MKTQIGDVKEWLTTNEDRVYGFLIYRRMFTPYEQDQKFEDETQFEDIHFTYGRIKEAVSLGGSDWLFGFQLLDEGDRDASGNDLEYYRLSDIQLYSYDWMQHKFDDEDEDE